MMIHETIPQKVLATMGTHRFCSVMENHEYLKKHFGSANLLPRRITEGNQGFAQGVSDNEKPG